MAYTELKLHTANRILSAFRGGSSWPVVVETDAGRFVTKLRGAAQGVLPLVAEVVVAELATRLGLSVPERVLVELAEETPSDDGRDELRDLLRRSIGKNLGFRFLDGATDLRLDQRRMVDPTLAARVAWLDGLVSNADRTAQNPNVLLWHGQPWLVDHGACLPFHYDWAGVTEESPRVPGPDPRAHLFAGFAAPLADVDETCAALLGREDLTTCVARIPIDFLADAYPGEDGDRVRARYVAFLWKRLRAPRPFVAGPV